MSEETVLNNPIAEAYWREKIAQEIELAIIKVAGDSAATIRQAADIARGRK